MKRAVERALVWITVTGRLESIIAAVILTAVVYIFLRYYTPEPPPR